MLLKKFIVTLSALMVITAHADQFILTTTGHDNLKCRDGHRCTLTGEHEVQIMNESNEPRHYWIDQVIYLNYNYTRTGFQEHRNYVLVPPHSMVYDHYTSSTVVRVPEGNHMGSIETMVGQEGTKIYKLDTKLFHVRSKVK
jgi:hypothetical protein